VFITSHQHILENCDVNTAVLNVASEVNQPVTEPDV